MAVLGIGQALAGDDGLGCLVARRLRAGGSVSRWLIIDAGTAPEACTGTLRRFRPHLVVLIDAVEMGVAPGSIAWFDTWQADGVSGSTHDVPLHVVADYLRIELECEVGLLGVQPASVEFGEPLSKPVRHAARSLVSAILRLQ